MLMWLIILLKDLKMLKFGWWIVYMMVRSVLMVFFMVRIMIVVVFALSFDVGSFMKIMDGLVISFIVTVSFFFCLVDSLFIFGSLIKVFFKGFNSINFIIFLMNIWSKNISLNY